MKRKKKEKAKPAFQGCRVTQRVRQHMFFVIY